MTVPLLVFAHGDWGASLARAVGGAVFALLLVVAAVFAVYWCAVIPRRQRDEQAARAEAAEESSARFETLYQREQTSHTDTTMSLHRQYQGRIVDLEAENEERIAERDAVHARAIEDERRAHQERAAELQAKVEELTEEARRRERKSSMTIGFRNAALRLGETHIDGVVR